MGIIGQRTMYVLLALLAFAETAAAAGMTTAISIDRNGAVAYGDSNDPAISGDGRYVAFRSAANNLVPEDNNGFIDIFVHDLQTRETMIASVTSTGIQANGESSHAAISRDGRYVAFRSAATNLVPEDSNGRTDIFVHDRQTGKTMLISGTSSGAPADGDSSEPAISADGRYIAFQSVASNLVPGDKNDHMDVFLHDRETRTTTLLSRSGKGALGNSDSSEPAISANGRYVAFRSRASNLVPGDKNGHMDVFLHDRKTSAIKLVSKSSKGRPGNRDSGGPALSADGRYVAFESAADDLVAGDANGSSDIFLHNVLTGATLLVSRSMKGGSTNGPSSMPAISGDGRYIAFESAASNLVSDDVNGNADGFVYDRKRGKTELISKNSEGSQANKGGCIVPSISTDGRYIAFESESDNLVQGDGNKTTDIFVHERARTP